MTSSSVADRYLDLLLECVNGSVYGAPSQLVAVKPEAALRRRIFEFARRHGLTLARQETVANSALEEGVGWPKGRWNPGQSMIGRARLQNVRDAVTQVLEEGIPGDFIETGVWRGGACIVAKAVLDAHGDDTRKVFVADSFAGLPPADDSDDAADLHFDTTLAISKEQVAAAFEQYGLLDDRVVFLKGWFSDTLPGLTDNVWSVIRLDGDMYESTMDGLVNLYPQLSPGGFLIVDDYNTYESCRRAVDEYRAEHGINEELVRIDNNGAYWRKSPAA